MTRTIKYTVTEIYHTLPTS